MSQETLAFWAGWIVGVGWIVPILIYGAYETIKEWRRPKLASLVDEIAASRKEYEEKYGGA